MLIDTHAHLGDEVLIDRVDDIIEGMRENNINYIFEIGYSMESSLKAVELAEKYRDIYAVIGIHPQESEHYSVSDIDNLKKLAENPKVKAIGEIGLDYHYDYDRNAQKSLFISMLKLADELNLPVVIHLRDAYEEMYNILCDCQCYINNGILFHCYSGSKEMIERFKFLDPYYAFGGAITFKNNNKAEVIKAIPRNRLLLETDSPYMTPVPYRGKINTPLNLPLIAEKMAVDVGVDISEIELITTLNAKAFYRINNK